MVGLVSSTTLQPGQTADVRIRMQLVGKSGRISKWVDLVSNDALEPKIRVPVTAEIEHWKAGSSSETLESVLFHRPECAKCHAKPVAGLSGKDTYYAVCAVCHLWLQDFAKSLSQDELDRDVLREWTANGNADVGMPGFAVKHGGMLSDAQIESVVSAIRAERASQDASASSTGTP